MSQRQLEGYVCMYACMCVIFIRCDRRTSNNKHKKQSQNDAQWKAEENKNTEFVLCWRHEQLAHVIGIGPQWATTNVRQKATVVCEVRGSRSNERLMHEPRDLEHNALTHWQHCFISVAYATFKRK